MQAKNQPQPRNPRLGAAALALTLATCAGCGEITLDHALDVDAGPTPVTELPPERDTGPAPIEALRVTLVSMTVIEANDVDDDDRLDLQLCFRMEVASIGSVRIPGIPCSNPLTVLQGDTAAIGASAVVPVQPDVAGFMVGINLLVWDADRDGYHDLLGNHVEIWRFDGWRREIELEADGQRVAVVLEYEPARLRDSCTAGDRNAVSAAGTCLLGFSRSASWFEAANQCQAIGARLATFESAEELAAALPIFDGWVLTSNYQAVPWIGGIRLDGAWQWLGEGSLMTFTSWATDRPWDNGDGWCTAMNANGQWHDAPCTVQQKAFLCEREPS